MKKIYFAIIATLSFYFANAQAFDSQADYSNQTQAAVMGEYKYPQETIEKTLRDRLNVMGIKLKSSKGFLVATNTVISSISSIPMDYAFKIDRKCKREKDVSTIALVISINGVNATAANSAGAKVYLNELLPAIDATNTDNMVNDQYSALTKAQKKLKNLQDDQASMEKRIRNLQDDLSRNAKEQTDQQKEVQKQQEILDAYKAKKAGL